MSNALAIAAVTATIGKLLYASLQSDLGSPGLTTRPLDSAREKDDTSNQLNLFLYQITYNAAWRNLDIPGRGSSDESSVPLAVDLHYLITAYGPDDSSPKPNSTSHRLLGKAMSVLHEHAVLLPEETKDALADNDLWTQVERIRITPQSLTLDEISKLWTSFQTQYRTSVAYQVSVVLIDAQCPARIPLPVLMRGAGDRGVISSPSAASPFPAIEEVNPPKRQPSAHLGDTLTIVGHHLDGQAVQATLTHRRLKSALVLPVATGTDTRAGVPLANDSAKLPAGAYQVSLVIQRAGEPDRSTNELSFTLAPAITSEQPWKFVRGGDKNVVITLQCRPVVLAAQTVSLLVGDRELRAADHPQPTDTIKFPMDNAPAGTFPVRLRVDGVDSLVVQDYEAATPVFDPNQVITIV